LPFISLLYYPPQCFLTSTLLAQHKTYPEQN